MTAPDREQTLQRYFDGELPPAEADALRARLESDPELSAKLAGLEHLRALLRAALAPEVVGADVDASEVFEVIEARIAAANDAVDDAEPLAPPPERPALRVVEGEGSAPAPAAAPRGRILYGILGGALAAAAAAFLVFAIPRGTHPEPSQPPVAENTPAPGSEIEDVDFGYSTGAIFQVEGQEGTQYAVVWISDEKVEYTVPVPDEREERVQ